MATSRRESIGFDTLWKWPIIQVQRLLAHEDFTTRALWCFWTNRRLGGVLLSAIGCRRVSRFALHRAFAASRQMRWRTEQCCFFHLALSTSRGCIHGRRKRMERTLSFLHEGVNTKSPVANLNAKSSKGSRVGCVIQKVGIAIRT
jgi:hypothetical protein